MRSTKNPYYRDFNFHMHRVVTFLIGFFLFSLSLSAQDSSLVNWKVDVTPGSDGKYELKFNASIQPGWQLYAYPSKEDDIEGVLIHYRDETIKHSSPEFLTPPLKFQDKIFEKQIEVAQDSFSILQTIEITQPDEKVVRINLQYYIGNGSTLLPEERHITVSLDQQAGAEGPNLSAATDQQIKIKSIDLGNPVSDCGEMPSQSSGLWSVFLLGILGGFIALLTPCVFPMIPLTVSFFTKKAQSRQQGIRSAFLYGFFILLIYVLLSLPFHLMDNLNPEILNNISTNVILNIIFFVIFIVFAFSFFGFYEIVLPSSFSNKTDSKAGSGNIIGIFFMALTLAIVSFSCTGPILGSLLAGSLSADGGAIQLTVGMTGFGLALALPFGLFALFPNWLQSLPKSGGWLTTVKIVLGFLELALAFKFLSNADLVSHWGILKREIFIGIWIVIGIALSLYLFGIIKFSHEGPVKKIGIVRKIVGLMSIAFTLYLIPGLTNSQWANLRLISGFPPPLYYSIYAQQSECVLDLNCVHDYQEGLALARAQNKPMLIDFTGYACVNCRRMEENVWTDPDVYKVMHENYIIVSLYVDDKRPLPASQQISYTTSDGVKKEIETIGDKWSTFETENFKNNAQPLYAIVDTQERLLTHPVPYTPNAQAYLEWLNCGLAAFEKK